MFYFLDLYCSSGILCLLVNKYFKKCIGIEINNNYIYIANYNKKINNSNNCEFICNNVENYINNINFNFNNLVIFINPSKNGINVNIINKLNLLKNKIKQILYLSNCKKTLDHDLNLFNFNNKILEEFNIIEDINYKEYLVLLN